MLLGCIGDDFTGSSDLANTLSKAGMQTVQYTGIPNRPAANSVEAGVISLKSRSIAADDAVRQSLDALAWLQEQGCVQFFFKYCSTFDSKRQGNIGPVADALADAQHADQVIVCPAFPGTGRTLYQGHLFVHDRLLNESGLEHHPLNPMTDPDIRRWLGYQSRNQIGLVGAAIVLQGRNAIRHALQENGNRLVVVDAIVDQDLLEIGAAADGFKLVTGGSGVAMGLPENFKRRGEIEGKRSVWRGQIGIGAILSGSCSNATREQVRLHAEKNPAFEIEAEAVIEGTLRPEDVTNWLLEQSGLPMAYSSANPEKVAQIQTRFGQQKSASALEYFFARLARNLVEGGVTRLISAGGETSGAIIEGLDLNELEIGPEIDPGVPALRARPDLVLALKSGNFGTPDFFEKAARILAGG